MKRLRQGSGSSWGCNRDVLGTRCAVWYRDNEMLKGEGIANLCRNEHLFLNLTWRRSDTRLNAGPCDIYGISVPEQICQHAAFWVCGKGAVLHRKIGRAHVLTPVTWPSRMPS